MTDEPHASVATPKAAKTELTVFRRDLLNFRGVFLRFVANTDDFHVRSFHPVNHKVVFVRDEFASSGDAPRYADA